MKANAISNLRFRSAAFRPGVRHRIGRRALVLVLAAAGALPLTAQGESVRTARASMTVSAIVVRPCVLTTAPLVAAAARRHERDRARVEATDCPDAIEHAQVRWADATVVAGGRDAHPTAATGPEVGARILEIRF